MFIVHATAIICAKQSPVISVSIPTDTFLMPVSYHTVSGYLNGTSQGKLTEGKGSVQMASRLM
jgi:hypothetical protein